MNNNQQILEVSSSQTIYVLKTVHPNNKSQGNEEQFVDNSKKKKKEKAKLTEKCICGCIYIPARIQN